VLGTIGCNTVSPIYTQTAGSSAGGSIPPKTTWTIRGDLSNLTLAIDGDVNTAARGEYQQAGAEITLDLGRACMIQTVILDHGQEERGFPRTLSLLTSADGKNFVERHVGPGTRRVTILSLSEPALTRYIRLKVVKPGTLPWSVAEVYVQ
jgi:hypothetical protein